VCRQSLCHRQQQAKKSKNAAKKKKKNQPEETEAVEKAAKAKKDEEEDGCPCTGNPPEAAQAPEAGTATKEAQQKTKKNKDVPVHDTQSEAPEAKKTKKAVTKKAVNKAKATVVGEYLDYEGAADCIFDHQGTVDFCIKCEHAHDLEDKLKVTNHIYCLTPYDSGNIVPSEKCPVSLCNGNKKTHNQEGKRCKCSVCFTCLVKRMKQEEEHRNEQAANGATWMSRARKQTKQLGV
jgi:hypothetical protein